MKLKISEDESLPIYEDAEGNWFIPLDGEALKDLKKEIQDIIDEEMIKSLREAAIIEHNRSLIQKVLGRPFLYKPFETCYSREDFLKQVDEREEAEYLERVYGIKNPYKN